MEQSQRLVCPRVLEVDVEKMVNTALIQEMREKGVITPNEVLYEVGDLYVAEDVVTRQRRTVEVKSYITEARRVLKG